MSRAHRSLCLALLVMAAMAGLCATAGSASAYTQLFRPFGGQPLPDPCADAASAPTGAWSFASSRIPGKPSLKRYVALLCGPRRALPASVLLSDDQIWQYALGRTGHTDTHMMRGGLASLPWKGALSTKSYPYDKGPSGHAPSFDPSQISTGQILEQMLEVLRAALADPGLQEDAVECVLGALESEGESCIALLADLGFIGVVEAGIAVQQLFQIVQQFLQSRVDMANSDWFYWSDGTGFWDGFGDVGADWINPSITLSDVFFRHESRIGVVFSNVALAQGPDFGLPGLDRPGTRIRGRRLFGSSRGNRLTGTLREDFIEGGGGNDVIRGRGGNDILLQGGRGDDRIYAGAGADNIDGYRGRDLLDGGRGNDQILDLYGPTIVHAGGGTNLVIVRDGHGDDRVDCRGSTRNVVEVDRGDRVDRSCRRGRSRVVRGGPHLRVGAGY